MAPAISLNTKFTLSLVLVSVPLFVWAGRLDSEVTRLKEERAEMRQELREIRIIVQDIRSRQIAHP